MYVVKITDGLGNQMFQYALARKLQMESGRRVYLDTRYINNEDRTIRDSAKNIYMKKNDHREYRLNYFKIRVPEADERLLARWEFLKCINERQKALFRLSKGRRWLFQYVVEDQDNRDDFLAAIPKFMPAYLEGYFFYNNFFEDIKEVLQRDFRLKKPIKLSAELRKVLENEETVSIHVRRGDFLKHNRDISEKGYYNTAITMMQKYVANPTWLVFSDDIEWVKAHLNIPGKKVYVSGMGYEDYEELTIMKNCKNHITANSTFSFWAAYLNSNEEKVVICPDKWRTEIVPQDWIKV